MASRRAWLAACVLTAACGQKASQERTRAQDAGVARDAAGPVLAALPAAPAAPGPLGLPTLEGFRYRAGAGAAALRTARRALAAGDDDHAITAARAARARDPQALEAAWVLARALARRGHPDAVGALAEAVAGDPAWVAAALADPALAALLTGGAGEGWRTYLADVGAGYEAAVAEAIATGGIVWSAGELFAHVGRTGRWLRLTHTDEAPDDRGAVTAALVVTAPRLIVYATERAGPRPAHAVGVVAASDAVATPPIPVPGAAALVLAYSGAAPTAGVRIGAGAPPRWSTLAGGRLVPVPGRPKLPPGARVELAAGRARRIAGPVAGVSADWDEHARASALRITSSARTIAVPGEALIEGNTVVWSPARTHLAFAAQLGEACAPPAVAPTADAAVFVVEVATGKLTELARGAGGLAPQWLAERRLAIASPAGLTLVDLDGAAPVVVRDAALAAPPARHPSCDLAGSAPPEPVSPDR